MSTVEKVKARLSAYPGLRYSEQVDGIEIHALDPSGFDVGLSITPAGFTVHFDGWHEEFTSEDEALGLPRVWTVPEDRRRSSAR